MRRLMYLCFLFVATGSLVMAQATDSGLEIDGLIVDETHTRMGSDFYDLFYTHWEAPPEASNFTIIIMEQPVPQMGTRITLKINDDEVAQFMLQPRYDVIEEYAKESVRFLRQHLQEREMMRQRLEREGRQY